MNNSAPLFEMIENILMDLPSSVQQSVQATVTTLEAFTLEMSNDQLRRSGITAEILSVIGDLIVISLCARNA